MHHSTEWDKNLVDKHTRRFDREVVLRYAEDLYNHILDQGGGTVEGALSWFMSNMEQVSKMIDFFGDEGKEQIASHSLVRDQLFRELSARPYDNEIYQAHEDSIRKEAISSGGETDDGALQWMVKVGKERLDWPALSQMEDWVEYSRAWDNVRKQFRLSQMKRRVAQWDMEMKEFERIWKPIIQKLYPGLTIKNWTQASGYLGDEFQVKTVSEDYIDFSVPSAKHIQKVPKKDFREVWSLWNGYRESKVFRYQIREVTRFSKYIISVLKYVEDEFDQ